MKRLIVALVVCLFTLPAVAMQKWQGYCQTGGQKVSVPGLGQSTTKWMQSYPGCTITVYNSGGSVLATIYSDDGVTPKTNPFTADLTTGLAFFYAANGVYDIKFSDGGIASPFTLSAILLQDLSTPQSIGSIVFASGYTEADWCAQAMAADTAFASSPLYLIIDSNVASQSTCGTPPQPRANHTWFFDAASTFALGANSISPAGSNTRVEGQGYGTILTCTTGYCYDNDTHTGAYFGDFTVTPATTASGAIRIRHQTSASNANNWIWHVFVDAQSYTVGQIGALLYTAGNGDSNYANHLWLQTRNMDIGAKFQSADSVTNGSNANHLWITCNGHTVCVDVPNGTTEELFVSALGAHNLTNGIGVRFGGSSGGNAYGSSNNTVYFGAQEQGTGSTSVQYLSGATLNSSYGNASDASSISDTSGVTTNRSNFGGVLYNPIIGGNCLPFGGVASASSAEICRSGTNLQAKLGDGSAFTSISLTKLQTIVNSVEVDALTNKNLYLGSTSNLRHASLWGDKTGNYQTLYMMANNSTTDGSTFTAYEATYGSLTLALGANTADGNSNLSVYYRNASAANGIGTSIMSLSNLGLLTVAGGIVPSTAGGATSGSGTLPWSSVYIGGATNHYIQLTASPATGFTATLPNNTGTLAELNLAQSWTANQAFTTLSATGQITSTLATGTAPFVVSSTTVNTSLNADLLDGFHAGNASTGHAMCWKDASHMGYCSDVVSASGTCTCN